MSQVVTDTVIDTADNADTGKRSDTIMWLLRAITELWAIAPRMVRNAQDKAVAEPEPDTDAMSDGEIEQLYAECVKRAFRIHVKPGLLKGASKDDVSDALLTLFENRFKDQIKAIRSSQSGTADGDMLFRDALAKAADEFEAFCDTLAERGRQMATVVKTSYTTSVTLPGPVFYTPAYLLTKLFSGARTSKSENRQTVLSVIG